MNCTTLWYSWQLARLGRLRKVEWQVSRYVQDTVHCCPPVLACDTTSVILGPAQTMVLGWAATDQELGPIHRHCHTCFNVKRCTRDLDACPIVTCQMGDGKGCGWSYHECKESEHLELCPLVRVDCLNKEYGCDAEMLRRDIVAHLPVCPANIVTCSQEWNRYWNKGSVTRQGE